jgi:hypothetical protein
MADCLVEQLPSINAEIATIAKYFIFFIINVF